MKESKTKVKKLKKKKWKNENEKINQKPLAFVSDLVDGEGWFKKRRISKFAPSTHQRRSCRPFGKKGDLSIFIKTFMKPFTVYLFIYLIKTIISRANSHSKSHPPRHNDLDICPRWERQGSYSSFRPVKYCRRYDTTTVTTVTTTTLTTTMTYHKLRETKKRKKKKGKKIRKKKYRRKESNVDTRFEAY